MKYVVGIDVGGTFTDLVSIDETGGTNIVKVPSTPQNPGAAVIGSLQRCAQDLNLDFQDFLSKVIRICHGTTVSTNAILTLKGAKVGVLTTKGFRDIIEIRCGQRESRYDYAIPMPEPLSPRHLRIGIEERINYDGIVYTPLNKEEVRKAVSYFKEQGVEAISICFLWSFKNPNHEIEAAKICKEILPEAYLSLSSNILPEIREYRRFSTTVINSYVGPKFSSYVAYLASELKKVGYFNELLITQSSAGVMSPEIAAEQAMRTCMSGPACGPAAGVYLGKLYGWNNLITVDMGGTSFDVALIKEGKPFFTDEQDIAGNYRIRLPMVDVWTIGAGGGSIAWLGSGKVLHVGPASAGAVPGPACYMKGGTEPTVTDANVVLGYLNPYYYLGGEMKINPDASWQAIKEKIADPLGMSVPEAAHSIIRIVNANMADAISVISVRRGEDPRRYTLISAGAAGSSHAAALCKAMRIRRVIAPRIASVFCATGAVISDLRHDFVRTVAVATEDKPYEKLNKVYAEMEAEANEMLERENIHKRDRYFRRAMDMRYVGQFHEVETEVPNGQIDDKRMAQVVERFNKKHKRLYEYRDTAPTEIINHRLVGFGKVVKPELHEYPLAKDDGKKHIKGSRKVFWKEAGDFVNTTIWDGDNMEYGNKLNGPAVIELRTTTITVPPDCSAEVGRYGDFIVNLPEED